MRFSLASGVVLCALFLVISACEKVQMPAAGDETAAGEAIKAEEGAGVEIPAPATPGTAATIVIGDACFDPVEVASTDEERVRGLIGRESVPENGGMLFEFDRMGREAFHTMGTLIALDFIYIDASVSEGGVARPGKVVHVIEFVPPNSAEILESPVPFQYVLEVPGNTISRRGIRVGDEVTRRIGGCE